ncbi:hypothetical protein Salat_2783900 [Sesamum alatum]|uniref:Uncharacterized protein n=1 Tax=Sesamum alatum TaxID=300844 RepID=A0AAE1XKV8_9LAMI|nr:hypothetical protein Salat_2783900 [Sesamum alatum]
MLRYSIIRHQSSHPIWMVSPTSVQGAGALRMALQFSLVAKVSLSPQNYLLPLHLQDPKDGVPQNVNHRLNILTRPPRPLADIVKHLETWEFTMELYQEKLDILQMRHETFQRILDDPPFSWNTKPNVILCGEWTMLGSLR